MLIREGDERTTVIDVRLAAFLSAIAGAVSAAGFSSVGYFSANMTGNVSALSDYLATGRPGLALLFGSIVAAFIFGAFTSTMLIEAGRRRGVIAIYAYAVVAEAVLLAMLGLADLALRAVHSGPILILGLSFLMGVQNATTTRISNARVRTTHVSGMATDIGIAFAVMSSGSPVVERHAAYARLRLYGATVTAFLLGGMAGVMLYRLIGGAMLVLVAVLLLAIALPEIRRASRIMRTR